MKVSRRTFLASIAAMLAIRPFTPTPEERDLWKLIHALVEIYHERLDVRHLAYGPTLYQRGTA